VTTAWVDLPSPRCDIKTQRLRGKRARLLKPRITNGPWREAVFVFLCLAGLSEATAEHLTKMMHLSREDLCVTEGALEEAPDQGLLVNVPKMRAYVNELTPQAVEARITYQGRTEQEVPLGSGEMRRQFGFKLRAGDACNLVYAMWRIAPESKMVVSVKTNPGQHTSTECGNRGYKNVKATSSRPVPALRVGETHVLRAEMNGDRLSVFVDGAPVWEGSVGKEASAMQGPVGIRSDNARLQIQLRAAEPLGTKSPAPGCHTSPDLAE